MVESDVIADEVVSRLLDWLVQADTGHSAIAFWALPKLVDSRSVPRLIELLRHPNPTVRQRVIRIISPLGDQRSIQVLTELADDPEPEIHIRAWRALARLDSTSAFRAVVRNLGASESQTRRLAAHELWRFGSDMALPHLLTALQDHDQYVRMAALSGLHAIGDASVTSALRAVANDTFNQIRISLVTVLKDLLGAGSLGYLLPMLQDPDTRVRIAVIKSLTDIPGRRATQAIRTTRGDSHPAVRIAAFSALCTRGASRLDRAALVAASTDPSEHMRRAVPGLLVSCSNAGAVPLLERMLLDNDTWVRAAAVLALGLTGSRRAKRTLRRLVNDPDVDTRTRAFALNRLVDLGHRTRTRVVLPFLSSPSEVLGAAAIRALGQHHDPDLATHLKTIVEDTTSPPVLRLRAAFALTQVDVPSAVAALDTVVEDESAADSLISMLQYRIQVEAGIGAWSRPLTLSDSLAGLDNRRPHVRRRAVRALRRYRSVLALPGLLAALGDQDPELRQEAGDALGTIRKPRAAMAVLATWCRDPEYPISVAAEHALNQMGDLALGVLAASVIDRGVGALGDGTLPSVDSPPSVDALQRVLDHPHPRVRQGAYLALGGVLDPAATPALVSALRSPNVLARRAACRALGNIRDPNSIPHLLNILDDRDRDVRLRTARTLAAIGTPAVDGLRLRSQDPDVRVRRLVAWSLGRIRASQAVLELGEAVLDSDPIVARTAVWALVSIATEPARKTLDSFQVDGRIGADVRAAIGKAIAVLEKRGPQGHPR